jgi:hypothetical protein
MAQPRTLKFGNFIIELENPENAGDFIAPCAFVQKGLEFTANVTTQQIPDCDDPDAPFWEASEVSSLAMRLSASGIMALEHLPLWRTVFFSAVSVNARARIPGNKAAGGGHYGGKLVLTSFNHNASLGQKVEQAIAGQGDGPWTWTDAAA